MILSQPTWIEPLLVGMAIGQVVTMLAIIGGSLRESIKWEREKALFRSGLNLSGQQQPTKFGSALRVEGLR